MRSCHAFLFHLPTLNEDGSLWDALGDPIDSTNIVEHGDGFWGSTFDQKPNRGFRQNKDHDKERNCAYYCHNKH